MISILALRAVMVAAMVGVQGLAVVPSGDQTHVLIDVDGAVTYQHSMLSNPARIVVDVAGADLRLAQQRFLDINRGGVLGLRSSQYQAGVVRVVIDLAEAVDYTVDRGDGFILVAFRNPAGPFDAWRSATTAAVDRPTSPDPEPLGARTVAAPDRGRTPVAVAPPPVIQPQPIPQQRTITVEFRNTPIGDVLGLFADFSGRSIVPGQGVAAQTITATIQDQPWDEAMRAILAGQALTARELPTGIIMVTSMEHQRRTEDQEEIVTRGFTLQFVSADSVAPQIRSLLAEGEASIGTVAVNKATNTLIMSARQSVVDRVEALLPVLDRRTPQVTIKVRIISVSRTRARDMGIRYEILDGSTAGHTRIGTDPLVGAVPQISIAGSTIAALGNASASLPDATFAAAASLILGRHTLVTWIEAAQSLEMAELQADPTVRVLDHRTARIHVGERTPIRVVDPGAAGAQGPMGAVQTEETGVILEITPHVVGDQVLVQLHAERSFIQQMTADGQFVFGTAETSTQILVDDGATAVISGLTTTDLRRTRSGIPILMNIPLFGALFRFEHFQDQKEDLLIMVTPHIERAREL
jgi:type IV pilus assembly protein PilQ